MPKQVIVTTIWTCSLCEGETDAEKVSPFKLSGGGAVRTYDICATCVESGPFAAILDVGMSERSSSTGKKKAQATMQGMAVCQYCDKEYAVNGMGVHQSLAHGVRSERELALKSRGKVGNHPCKECDFRAINPQGLGAHMRVRHGVLGATREAARMRAKKK